MSEEKEGAAIGPEGGGTGIDPAAMAMALGGASRDEADAFLRDQRVLSAKQTRLTDLQAHELSHELSLRHWSLWVRHTSGLLKLALELSAGLLLLALTAGIGLMVWNAVHSEGLIIESFSVPPDMAARGITGQAVASQMLDELTAMQNVTSSVRPAKSYANNWGDDIKVEIPETGMSVGEVYRFLRGWLGHETHISGEVRRTKTSITITARSGRDPGKTFAGTEDEFDALVVKAAEHVYGVTQPYRYAVYLVRYAADLGRPLRLEEGVALQRKQTESRDPLERAWAWNGLAVLDKQTFANVTASRQSAINTLAAYPLSIGFSNLADSEAQLGHPQAVLPLLQTLERRLADGVTDVTPETIPRLRLTVGQQQAMLLGDYLLAISQGREGRNITTEGLSRNRQSLQNNIAVALAQSHDGAARAAFRQLPPPPLPPDRGLRALAGFLMEAGLQNWRAVVALQPDVEQTWIRFNQGYDSKTAFAVQVRPWTALAKARLGDVSGAQALIAATPGDCYDCARIRGRIAGIAGQQDRADWWFARAVHDAPSIPFAYTDWGQALLARGQPDAAIEKFAIANQKGPHFADPLEMWGEALMAKNQSHLALAKFSEADKYAPNWGRLHLKWGEALAYLGKREEAQKRFARAAALDLTPSEKAELTEKDHV